MPNGLERKGASQRIQIGTGAVVEEPVQGQAHPRGDYFVDGAADFSIEGLAVPQQLDVLGVSIFSVDSKFSVSSIAFWILLQVGLKEAFVTIDLSLMRAFM